MGSKINPEAGKSVLSVMGHIIWAAVQKGLILKNKAVRLLWSVVYRQIRHKKLQQSALSVDRTNAISFRKSYLQIGQSTSIRFAVLSTRMFLNWSNNFQEGFRAWRMDGNES